MRIEAAVFDIVPLVAPWLDRPVQQGGLRQGEVEHEQAPRLGLAGAQQQHGGETDPSHPVSVAGAACSGQPSPGRNEAGERVAHVAGALGKPVWLIDRFNTCWRWRLAADRSPWYPTMRIFRQERFGDWTAPLARVTAALATWL